MYPEFKSEGADVDAAGAVTPAPAAAAPANEPIAELGPQLRILIVEDDALIGMLLCDMLEIMGHAVCAVEATEAGAVSAADRYAPDLMIIDAHLREGSGLAAVDRILAQRMVPHVFVTGDVRGVSKGRPGAVVLSKPFTEAALANAMLRARTRA